MAAPVVEGTKTFAGTDGTNASTLSPNKPTGLADGEKLVAVLTQRASETVTPPTDFALVAEETSEATNSGHCYIRIYEKNITNAAGEPATYTFTQGTSNSHWGVTLFRVSGGTTWDTAGKSSTRESTADTSVEINSIITPENDCLVWYFIGLDAARNVTTIPSGTTQIQDTDELESPSPGRAHAVFTMVQSTAGATGSKTADISANAEDAVIVIALRPVAAATGRPTYHITLLGVS